MQIIPHYTPNRSKQPNWLLCLTLVMSGWLTSCNTNLYQLQNDRYSVRVQEDYSFIIEEKKSGAIAQFEPKFAVLFRADNPKLAIRPANIPKVAYNVPSWENLALAEEARLAQKKDDGTSRGDGFDVKVLLGKTDKRTANFFLSGDETNVRANEINIVGDTAFFEFEANDSFTLRAYLLLGESTFPEWNFMLTPKVKGYFSVAYLGAPSFNPEQLDQLWQPLIWQEKRFPDQPYLTLAYRCPIPSTLVHQNHTTLGVVAAPSELPFQPLPLLDNSRFGVALRNQSGLAQPILVAPVLGGMASEMEPGTPFAFKSILFLSQGEELLTGFETIARDIMGFRDYRSNAIGSLNETIENIIEYGMSDYSWFVDSLKGCAYSTDVPGAVKNVSSLHPFEVALIYDREDVYQKRAYPIIEYLLSREKFLFSLDPEQKIQQPSRKLNGPAAPMSELAALYHLSGGQAQGLRQMAEDEMASERIRNLDKVDEGATWQNQLAMYRATGEATYLDKAIEGGLVYVKERVETPSDSFAPNGFFFWPDFTPDYINLYQLYEASKDELFLKASQKAARQFATFTWFGPNIPNDSISVNTQGMAPHYWYLKGKGHPQMEADPERVPAWRLSEIGLAPEGAGTSNGHRAVFMAHHAPWMLRIGYETEDSFLMDIARSAVVGRYLNFPGYHINTARTTVYEKANYPFRPHKELSVNSFHYNHIFPLASNLIDYLISDFYVKSQGQIDFPSEYIEGYAYLENKFYGHRPGKFYEAPSVRLWMPKGLVSISSIEVNYMAARDEDQNLYLALSNQSNQPVKARVSLNPELVHWANPESSHSLTIQYNNQSSPSQEIQGYEWEVEVPAQGLVSMTLSGLEIQPSFQHKVEMVESAGDKEGPSFVFDEKFKAMILDFGQGLRSLYVYHTQDDSVIEQATLQYTIGDKKGELSDVQFPFEWTVPMDDEGEIRFKVQVVEKNGEEHASEEFTLE
ncbi:MAG: hypothetical protein AAFP89_14060 [Bacteroidota bacterium]